MKTKKLPLIGVPSGSMSKSLLTRILLVFCLLSILAAIVLSRVTQQREWILLIALALLGIAIVGPFLMDKDPQDETKQD
jgi:hypothetical protein